MKRVYKFEEAVQNCGFPDRVLVQFIERHWIEPQDREKKSMDEEDLARARLIFELQNDLGVNDEAVPIILHLIDELNHLHLQMRRFSSKRA